MRRSPAARRARAGTLSIMTAGTDNTFAVAQPVLEALGRCAFRVGHAPGQGTPMKLVNNLLAGVNLAAAAQVLALGARAGLDAQTMAQVIRAKFRCELDRRRSSAAHTRRRLRAARAVAHSSSLRTSILRSPTRANSVCRCPSAKTLPRPSRLPSRQGWTMKTARHCPTSS
jgi:3-hydroxyisobutyrate dehydrogenase-like beta-hydroxyacid dehydrogenase